MLSRTKIESILFFGLLLTLTVRPFPAIAESDQTAVDAAAIDEYVEEQLGAAGIPGMSVAVVAGDQLVHARGYGEADPEGRPVTAQTPFMIGSTTKSMTAVAIMQLVEAGQLELDAPVQDYLPWFQVADSEAAAAITVRQLLTHTTGFSEWRGRETAVESDLSDDAMEMAVRALSDSALEHSPGERYEYSNLNYDVLGVLVQSVSGQSYESYLQEHLFDSLDMTHSFTSQQAATEDGLARGYVSWFGIPFARTLGFNRGHLASGHVMASAEDMAHYLIAQLNEGRYGDTSVLSPQSLAETHEPQVETDTADVFYAMGWKVDTSTEEAIISHAGANLNYSSFLLLLPDEKLGVVVLTNRSGFALVGDAGKQIATGVSAIVRGQEPEPYRTTDDVRGFIGSVVVAAGLAVLRVIGSVTWFVRRRPLRSLLGIGVPLVVDLVLVWILLSAIPQVYATPLRNFALMFPDMATLIFAGAAAVTVWAVVRTVLLARRPPPVPDAPIPEPTPPVAEEVN